MSLIKRIFAIALTLCAVTALSACQVQEDNDSSVDSVVSRENSEVAGSSAEVEESSTEVSVSEETTVEAALVDYTVTVVDSEGNPVAGALVQLCNDSTCFLPVPSDSEGKAVFSKEAGEYKACIAGTNDYVYFNDATEITITYDAPKA